MKMTKCQRCWKEIEARWARKYCTKCRKIVDDELSAKYIEKHKIPDNERKIKPNNVEKP